MPPQNGSYPKGIDPQSLRNLSPVEAKLFVALTIPVSSRDMQQVVALLRGTTVALPKTVAELHRHGMLTALFDRVYEPPLRRELMHLMGARLDAATRKLVEGHVERLGIKWQVQYSMARLGLITTAPAYNLAPYSSLIGGKRNLPFSGVGATGFNPTDVGVPLGDQARMLIGDAATLKKYDNPIPGSLPAYLAGLTPAQRSGQAVLLLRQPINVPSQLADAYGRQFPSRASVMRRAARLYNLEPELIAAFILAEQRDQSQYEDGKDYTAAVSLKQVNTSIGLGQVVISTARRADLFADLLLPTTRKRLSHGEIALLLASDEANIFAVARFLRSTANAGAKIPVGKLPNSKAKYPGLDTRRYSGNSARWLADDVRTLGSEYTSRAWDDKLSPGWGDFVYEAYKDVKASGVFKP